MGTTINLSGIQALDIAGISSASVSQGVVSFTIEPTTVIPVGEVLEWEGYGYSTAGLSWLAADTLAVGDGTQGDVSGGLGLTALILFGASAYSAYDSFHTTLMSGATMDWTLVLPETPGTSGQVLTTNGSGFTYWSNSSGGGGSSAWASLTGDLTISQIIPWDKEAGPVGTPGTGISILADGNVAFGNGMPGDVSGNLSYNRINNAGLDHAGSATITASATSVTVTYAAQYTGALAPTVVVTPTSDPLASGVPVGYWVVPTGETNAWTGFTLNLQTALLSNITFGYIVIGT